MRMNEVQVEGLREYLRIDVQEEDAFLQSLLVIGKAYICSYTGLTNEQADSHPEFSVVLLALCGELYENRQLTIKDDKVNPIIKSILDMHSINLL